MLRSTFVVAAIAFGDSLNPSTVVPAVYLTVAPSPVRRILEFTAGVFVSYLVCGALLLLGPGQLLLDALPHPAAHKRHLLEIAGGVVLVVIAITVWLARHPLARRDLPGTRPRAGASFVAGATLMLAEFPTAFPYFGAIAVIVGSGSSLTARLLLLVLFNVIFVAPLLAIAGLIAAFPDASRRVLEPVAGWLTRRWPTIFAALALVLGVVLAIVGISGLAGEPA